MAPRAQIITILPALAIVAAALFIYAPALNGAWLWDDNLLIFSNARLHSLTGLGKIWFAAPTTDYWPLTWTLLWLEWHLWGDAQLGYHLVTLALHVASAFLIWRILARLGLRRGWIGALLFTVHPLAVESVAWISEIKNTLSLPLFLLAFEAWLDAEEKRPGAYPRSVALYLLAMLAKTSTVMLPLVLALYCWWKRDRITRAEWLRLVPYIAVALMLGAVTLHFQNPDSSRALLSSAPPPAFTSANFFCPSTSSAPTPPGRSIRPRSRNFSQGPRSPRCSRSSTSRASNGPAMYSSASASSLSPPRPSLVFSTCSGCNSVPSPITSFIFP